MNSLPPPSASSSSLSSSLSVSSSCYSHLSALFTHFPGDCYPHLARLIQLFPTLPTANEQPFPQLFTASQRLFDGEFVGNPSFAQSVPQSAAWSTEPLQSASQPKQLLTLLGVAENCLEQPRINIPSFTQSSSAVAQVNFSSLRSAPSSAAIFTPVDSRSLGSVLLVLQILERSAAHDAIASYISLCFPPLLRLSLSLPSLVFPDIISARQFSHSFFSGLMTLIRSNTIASTIGFTAINLALRELALLELCPPSDSRFPFRTPLLLGLLSALGSPLDFSSCPSADHSFYFLTDFHRILTVLSLGSADRKRSEVLSGSLKALDSLLHSNSTALSQSEFTPVHRAVYNQFIHSRLHYPSSLTLKKASDASDSSPLVEILLSSIRISGHLLRLCCETGNQTKSNEQTMFEASVSERFRDLIQRSLDHSSDRECSMVACHRVMAAASEQLVRVSNQPDHAALVEFFRGFLLHSKRLSSHPRRSELRRSLVSALARVFLADLASSGSLARSCIQSLSACMLSTVSADADTLLLERHFTVLGELTAELRHSELSGVLMPMLVQRASETPELLKAADVRDALLEIAKHERSVDSQHFQSIVSVFVANVKSLSLSLQVGSSESTRASLLASLSSLCQARLPEDHRSFLSKRLIRLFVDLGVSAVERGGSSAACQSLLPIIAQSLSGCKSRSTSLFRSAASNVKWFRRVWFFLTVLGISSAAPLNGCQTALNQLAAHSPVLLIPNKFNYLGTDLELDCQQLGLGDSLRDSLKRQSTAVFGSNQFSSLTVPKLLFVLSVHFLESFRQLADPKSGIDFIFNYVADEDIKMIGVQKAILAISDMIFQPLLDSKSIPTELFQRLLVRLCSRYSVERSQSLCFVNSVIRVYPHYQWEFSCLSTLLTLIQSVHSSIDTDEQLNSAQSLSPMPIPVDIPGCQIQLPESLQVRRSVLDSLQDLSVQWLRTAADRVPKELANLVSEYIQKLQRIDRFKYIDWGIKTADNQSIHMRLHTSTQTENLTNAVHSGLQQALQANQNKLSVLVAGLSMKEQYLGEIRGLNHAFRHMIAKHSQPHFLANRYNSMPLVDADQSSGSSSFRAQSPMASPGGRQMGLKLVDSFFSLNNSVVVQSRSASFASSAHSDSDFLALVANHLVHEANSILYDFRALCIETQSQKSSANNDKAAQRAIATQYNEAVRLLHVRYETCMYQTVALLVWTQHENQSGASLDLTAESSANHGHVQDLLHLLCKLPSQIFTSQAMQIAVFAWEWLLTSCPPFELPLLMEMKAAWSYTIDRQVGMFSRLRSQRRHNAAALSQVKLGKPQTLQPPSGVAQPILPVPNPIERDMRSESLGFPEGSEAGSEADEDESQEAEEHPYAHVEIDVLSEQEREENTSEAIMPHRILIDFLSQQFCVISKPSILSVVSLMIHKAFTHPQRLSADASAFIPRLKLLAMALTLLPDMPLSQRAPLFDSIVKCGLSWFLTPLIWLDPQTQNVRSSSLKSDIAIIIQVCKLLNGPVEMPSSQRFHSLGDLKTLLLRFLEHEIDRLVVWFNPTRQDSLKIPDQTLFSLESRSISAAEWRRYTDIAWNFDPLLAIRLAQRLRIHSAISARVGELIAKNPERVAAYPESVEYYVTAEAVSGGQVDFTPLLLFHPCSLARAILLCSPPFSNHRVVLQYALSSLKSHPIEHVIFYLPQIVQILRHDSFGLISRFLLESASASILLSHQLIWLCQAELGEVKPTGQPIHMSPFRVTAQELVKQVVENFSPEAKQFFQDEFDFFNQITAISGILKPLPTKPLRKAKIKAELEKISVPLNVYLPTNPNLRVKEIITKSGTPMQSAAKVPILVAFKVVEEAFDEQKAIERRKSAKLAAQEIKEEPAVNGVKHDTEEKVDIEQEKEDKPEEAQSQAKSDDKEAEAGEVDLKEIRIETNVNGDAADIEVDLNSPTNLNSEVANQPASRSESRTSARSRTRSRSGSLIEAGTALSAPADEGSVFPQACIFKVSDDCRMDALALQIIQWCKNIFKQNHLELFLYPYRVLPNCTGEENLIGGIIECVPNAQTRDELGKAQSCSLKTLFLNRYGREEGAAFQQAQRNFITSLAGYALVSYILQVKDRHNGNVMIDEFGRLIHIDFGFIFDISPGRDMRFESAGFKLTLEMVELMGGSQDHPLYQWFVNLVIRGFLCVREHLNEILALVEPMLISTLHCFKPNSLANLKARFFPERDERGAAAGMKAIIDDAHDKWRTNVYDMIQKAQQNVYYFQREE